MPSTGRLGRALASPLGSSNATYPHETPKNRRVSPSGLRRRCGELPQFDCPAALRAVCIARNALFDKGHYHI